ncbi:MAG: response regulator [Pseudomonadota bacterium]
MAIGHFMISGVLQDDPAAILVVEDIGLIRMDAVDMAERAGFLVFEAANADDAITILETHPEIRLVFTDIEMPGSMDGLRFARYVSLRWPPIKLIVASGKVPREKADLPQGGLFFCKPYRHGEIATAMRALLAA